MTKAEAKKLKKRFAEHYFVRSGDWNGLLHVQKNPDNSMELYEVEDTRKKEKLELAGLIVKGGVYDHDHYVLNIDQAEYLEFHAQSPEKVLEMYLENYDAYVKIDNLIDFVDRRYGKSPLKSR